MSEDPMLGRVLADRFEIESLVGRGGMASVYRARDTVLDRVVAVKLFAVDTSEDRARLESEVRLLSRLNHPNLVTVHDAHLAIGPHDGPSFLVMELVSGESLREAIATAGISGETIAVVASGIGEALHIVHEAGIVHRDVKPANILIERGAPRVIGIRAKLADFGIAHSLGSTRLTATHSIVGTAGYLSPEQAAGAAITSASDIYSLGLVLLECFTGRMAFPGTPIESLAARLGRDPELPTSLPAGWSALLGSMLARTPADRPTALGVARTSALLTGELGASYPESSADPSSLAETRLLPVATVALPVSSTAVTRVITEPSATVGEKPPTKSVGKPHFPVRIVLISVAVVVVLAVVLSLIRGLSMPTPMPSTSISSSTPSPSQSAPMTPSPSPTKNGNGHVKKP